MSNTQSAAQVPDAGVPYDGYGPPPEDGSPHDAGYLIPLPGGPGYQYIDPTQGAHAALALASAALNLVPILGDIKGVIETVTGEDLLTGDELGYIERTLHLLPVLAAAGEFAAARAALQAGVRATADVAETLAMEARAADVTRRAALVAKDGAAASTATLEMLDKLDEAAVALAKAEDAASEGARLGAQGIALKGIAEAADNLVDAKDLAVATLEVVGIPESLGAVETPTDQRVPTDSGPPHPVDESDAPASLDQAGAPSMADVASYDPSAQGDLTSQADDDPSSQGGDAAAGTFNMEQDAAAGTFNMEQDAAAVKNAGEPATPAEEQQASFPGDDEEPDPETEQSTAEPAPAEAVDACFPGDDETSVTPGTSGDAATSGEAGASPQTSTDDGDDGFGE
jgi:Pre-toxin TG